MVIDDSATDNFIAEHLIKKTGLAKNVIIETNVESAIATLTKSLEHKESDTSMKPEILLVDIAMPVLDGFDFLKKYEELDPACSIRTYLLTAAYYVLHKEKAKNFISLKGFIHKPLTEAILEELKGGLSADISDQYHPFS